MKRPVLYKKTAYHIHPQLDLNLAVVRKIGKGKRNLFPFFADLEAVFDTGQVLFSHAFYQEKEKLYAKSHNKKRQVQKNLQKRHILVDQINVVSGRIPGLKMIVARSGRSAAYMVETALGAYQFS